VKRSSTEASPGIWVSPPGKQVQMNEQSALMITYTDLAWLGSFIFIFTAVNIVHP